MAYATRDDMFAMALPAQAFVTGPRPIPASDVDAATATFRLRGHGLSESDVLTFVRTSGGTLPTGISAFATYTPTVVSSDLFRLRGVASFVSVGNGWAVAVDQGRRIDLHLAAASALIDEHLTAHQLPISRGDDGEYPMVLRQLCARIAARACSVTLEFENPVYRVALDRLFAQENQDLEILKAWKAGKPIQPRPIDADAGVAENAARAYSSPDAAPWLQDSL